MDFYHKPVMMDEIIKGLEVEKNGVYVDCTLGGGGHTREISKLASEGKVISIDQDTEAIKNFEKYKKNYSNVITVKDNFLNIDKILKNLNIQNISGALLDLGVSSYQLDNPERGFSYNENYELDMRMNSDQKLTARHIVNGYTKDELRNIIYQYGEEKWADRIAEFIVKEREDRFIETTFDLVEIIKKAIPRSAREDGPHPAKRTFQAIRIEVNKELDVIEPTIKKIVDLLDIGGRICVITFHSLEDRIVKNTFKWLEKDCICPPKQPICTCSKKRQVKIITKKPIEASDSELKDNPRARSAKLRIAKKI
jgi:16S rRNA (cytosine1402-N4)-methyltransferase